MKYAILLDGAFVIAKLRNGKTLPTASDIMAKVSQIKSHDLIKDHEHLRTYFYHAAPATDELINPISRAKLELSTSDIYRYNESLIQTLETQPDMAVRLGELSANGWMVGGHALKDLLNKPRQITERDLIPNIKQKGVDLRIALDIARLSLRGIVDTLVIVTGDSDFIPAFKFARREGLRIFLDHMRHGVKRELKVHVDRVLDLPSLKASAPKVHP